MHKFKTEHLTTPQVKSTDSLILVFVFITSACMKILDTGRYIAMHTQEKCELSDMKTGIYLCKTVHTFIKFRALS